jgi:transposase
MSKRIFSEEEQAKLRTNKHIAKVSAKRIVYAETFIRHALTAHQHGMPPCEIFMHAGFDLQLIGSERPTECLKRWRKKKASIPRSETNRLRWLEAEVKYLKAENAFLAQLRAKRAE